MKKKAVGALIRRTVFLIRWAAALKIRVYAAGACYYLVLAAFPALLLLLGLVRLAQLDASQLGQLLEGIIPDPLLEGIRRQIAAAYDRISASAIGLSALTTLWPASRGMYGLLMGLNGVYGIRESRGWLRTRLLCMVYTLAFLLVLVMTLLLQVFGARAAALMARLDAPFFHLLTGSLDLRFVLLLALQSGLFTAMFLALPDRHSRFREVLPGALLASAGWLLFSNLYCLYVERFAHLGNIYGSVYGIALSMLWLYCCLSIVFYGGVLNRILAENVDEL